MRFITTVLILSLCACAPKKEVTQIVSPVESKYIYVAGVIRYVGNEWTIIEDENHTNINIDHLVTYPDNVRIYYNIPATKVILFIVSPDETYVKYDIITGASSGTDYAYVNYAQDGVQLTSAQMGAQGGNLWIYGIFERQL